jgi:general secretion pathway protein J
MSSREPVPSGHTQSGFTLLELVIGLSLVSIIMLMLFSSLSLGSRTWEGLEARNQALTNQLLVRGFIQRSLLQARFISLPVEDGSQMIFSGDATRLEYAAPLSRNVGFGGLYILRLGLLEVDGRQQLQLTRWLAHPEVLEGNSGIPAWEPLQKVSFQDFLDSSDHDGVEAIFGQTPLLEDVEELTIEYYGTLDGEQGEDWHEEWLEQQRPPRLVRMRIRTVTTTAPWPDLLIQLSDA